jgi:hypothetical protein
MNPLCLASHSQCLHEPSLLVFLFPVPAWTLFARIPIPSACMNPISLGLPVLMPAWTLFPLASQS